MVDATLFFSLIPPYIGIGVTLYLYSKARSDNIKSNSAVQKADLALNEIREHKVECKEINKEVLQNQISNLSDKFDTYLDAASEFRKDIKEEFKLQRERAHTLSNTIHTVLLQIDGKKRD